MEAPRISSCWLGSVEEFMSIIGRRNNMYKALEKKELVENSRSWTRTKRVLRVRGKVAGEETECLGRSHILHFLRNFKDFGIYSDGSWKSLKFKQERGKLRFNLIFFFLCKVTPEAYRNSWARGWLKAIVGTYTTATAMPDPNCICNLYHSL